VAGIVIPPGLGEKAICDELTVAERHGAMRAGPHIHRAHADAFYVLGGELEFPGATLRAGSLMLAPPGVVHWFRTKDARFLNIHAPGEAWAQRLRAQLEGRTVDNETADTFDPPDGATGEPHLARPGEGERLENDERVLQIKAARPELCVFEFDAKAGYTGPGPHIHREHVDAFYVLEGELEFALDGETVRAPAGTFVAATPGVVHTFTNAADAPVRFLNLHAPGMRFDEYLRRMDAGESGRRFHESFDVYETED
jgi:quercetin dioxygenase-like cupin family protein